MSRDHSGRLEAIARQLGFGHSDAELELLVGVAEELVDGARLPAEAIAEGRTAPPRRPGRPGTPADGRVHGWAWRCEVTGAADGPLAGRTVGLKDNIGLAGHPLGNGSAALADVRSDRDATVVTRLLAAGATVIGRTSTTSFCADGAGVTGHPLVARNPHDADRLTGGSSSGSAAVVAAGEADIGMAGDQGGSIRGPASWCGAVGLKPTHGLVPCTGIVPVEPTIDHVGPITRTVQECADVLRVIAGPDGRDPRQLAGRPMRDVGDRDGPRLAFGVLREGFDIPDASEPVVDATVRALADALARDGHRVVEVSVPQHDFGSAICAAIAWQGLASLYRNDGVLIGGSGEEWDQLAVRLGHLRRDRPGDIPPAFQAMVLAGERLQEMHGAHGYAQARAAARRLTDAYDEPLADVDVLLMPTTPMRAPIRPSLEDPAAVLDAALGLRSGPNLMSFDATGHPALTVPCQAPGTLPIGAQLVARHGHDALALLAGMAVERAVRAMPNTSSRPQAGF